MNNGKSLPAITATAALLTGSMSALAADDIKVADLSAYAVPAAQLEQHRAKQGFDVLQQMNDNNQQSNLSQNQLQSHTTGANTIYEGAMQGIEGIATVIQNSGNQVIIQDSTLLNITVNP